MGRHCKGQNLKTNFFHFFLYQYEFFYKAECISIPLLYMWVEDELMNTHFTTTNWIFQFSEIFPIVIPIVLQKCGGTPEFSL